MHGFDTTEFEARAARAQAAMAAAELDALLVSSPPNIRYLTGFATEFYESPTRPWFVILPAQGEAIAVVPEIGAPEMARAAVGRVESWPAPQPEDDGVSLLAATLAALPRRFGRVGAELGREMALRMPLLDFDRLRRALAGVEIVDGGPTLWGLRQIKSAAEQTRLRAACAAASRAYAAAPELIAVGATERAAAKAMKIRLLQEGADAVPFLPAISGPGGVAQIICGPSDRVIETGDVLFMDTGATVDGYFCDFDRLYAAGPPDDAAARTHELLWRATEAGVQAARVGATAEDLFRAMAHVLEEAGGLGGNVGRLGHGFGLQLTEPPSHRLGDQTVLRAGMALTIEPGVEYAPGKMLVHEENILLHEDGPELITERAPQEMPRLGG